MSMILSCEHRKGGALQRWRKSINSEIEVWYKAVLGTQVWGADTVTETQVWQLAARKPILERQRWWEEKFALFWRLATRGEGGLMSKGQLSTSHQWARAFKGEFREGESEKGGGYMQKPCSQLWQSSWNWSCGGLISVILIVLSTVNLQFQGQFVPVSLRPVLRTVAVHVMVTVWSSHS